MKRTSTRSSPRPGGQRGDETELVRGSKGADGRSKKGDFVAMLGKSSGAPGARIAVEVKDQQVRLKAAIEELQEAKANREASAAIFVFARGIEPSEIGDFRRIGEDFYCTVELADLEASPGLHPGLSSSAPFGAIWRPEHCSSLHHFVK